MSSVLILGSGLLAHELRVVFHGRGWRTYLRSRANGWDITKPLSCVDGAASGASMIVNAAGYTGVDAAEDHPREAFAANALGAENVATLARSLKVPLVHVSTDAVFHEDNGDAGGSVRRTELDTPNPVSVYGRSKLLGERLATKAYPETTIARLANLYGAHGRNWPSTLRARLVASEELHADRYRMVAPTWARWAAEVIFGLRTLPGDLCHVCPDEWTTWSAFAFAMAQGLGVETRWKRDVPPVTYKARRSDVGALASVMMPLRGIDIPTWNDLLSRYLNEEPAGDRSVVEQGPVPSV